MDRALVERAQRGDRDAYELLAAASARRLYPIAYRIVRDRDQADDAVQQTLVAMWRELRGLRDPDRFETWSYRLVVRFCLAEARRHRRRGIGFVGLPESLPSERDDLADVILHDQLDRAFRALTPDHRVVLVLRHFAGLTLPEIAEVVGIPTGTVGSRIHHATRELRARLAADGRMPAATRVSS